MRVDKTDQDGSYLKSCISERTARQGGATGGLFASGEHNTS